jgi:cell wall-associated NlpC family hydrolase
MAQVAVGLAGDGSAYSANLNGLGNFYAAEEDALQGIDPVAGTDSLVIPRLAPRPLNEVQAPIADDATGVWSLLGSSAGVEIPLDQLAIEYAWFFGGVIAPFDSAGKLIGSLAEGGGTTGTTGTTGTVQVTVGPDGCPTDAPANTLRSGAAQIGVHKLCVESVRDARSPEAAMAIKYALTHLGYPYCECAKRNDPGYYDCSSFVSRAYRDGFTVGTYHQPGAIPNLYKGNAPTTGVLRDVPWTHQISLSQAMPGDLVEPHSGHVSMLLADGYKVHTNRTGDVSHVERAYTSAFWVGWVDHTKV